MKLSSILTATILMTALSALTANQASADMWCSLTGPTTSVPRGWYFYYNVDIAGQPNPGPPPPGGYPGPPFTIVFYGTYIPASGETIPGSFGLGLHSLTGYQNPTSGAASGTYVRYAKVYFNSHPGYVYCETNAITVVLD